MRYPYPDLVEYELDQIDKAAAQEGTFFVPYFMKLTMVHPSVEHLVEAYDARSSKNETQGEGG